MPSTPIIKYILYTECEQMAGSVEELARERRGWKSDQGGEVHRARDTEMGAYPVLWPECLCPCQIPMLES